MNPKVIFIISITVFLLISNIGFSINVDSDAEKLKLVFSNSSNVTSEEPYAGLVVDKPSDKGNKGLWQADISEVDNIIKSYEGKIGWKSSRDSHFYIDVPKNNKTAIVEDLNKIGYEVRDELIFKPLLNESLGAISAPYTYIDSENKKTNLTGKNRIIGIIDTGIDPNHQDFAGKILNWRDSVEIVDHNNFSSNTPYDSIGHGTLVASVAAGTGASSNGKFKGVALDAKLVVARACESHYETVGGETEVVVDCKERYVEDALDWMTGLGNVDAVTMSFGTVTNESSIIDMCTNMSSGMNNAIENAVSSGIFLVAAAGNFGPQNSIIVYNNGALFSGGNYLYPACTADVIAVGLTYKKNYQSNEYGTDFQDVLKVSSKIHVIVEVNGANVSEHEWEVANGETGGMYSKLGFDVAIPVPSWPARVKIKFEGMDRVIRCNSILGCFVYYEKWWPGNESKGDAFWEDEYTFNQGKQIVVQFSAWPKVDISSDWAWTYWHSFFYTDGDFEKNNGVKYYNIYYLISNATDSLKNYIPFLSDRGMLPNRPNSAYPDVVAPGYEICAANSSQGIYTDSANACGNAQYLDVSGSSFAVPHIVGLIALLKEANPTASYSNIKNAVFNTADTTYNEAAKPWWFNVKTDGIWDAEGHGRINVTRAINYITSCKLQYPNKGYNDTDLLQCSNYDYGLYSSANQMREYIWSDSKRDCDCNVIYDSFINASANGISSGDVIVPNSDNLSADINVKNTGTQVQNNWYVGVEFWNVSDYTKIMPGSSYDQYRSGRINAFYNGSDGTHGCILNPDPIHGPIGSCITGVDCRIISESVNANGKLDVGETIRVRCQAPASFYHVSTGNQRVMLWIHERDQSQDANNDGNVGSWWWDALSTLEAAGVRFNIKPVTIRITSPVNGANYTRTINLPLNFTISSSAAISWMSYSLDYKSAVSIKGNTSLTNLFNGNHNVMVYAGDSSGNILISDRIYFLYCLGDANANGRVDLADLTMLALSYNKNCSQTGYDARADFNGDCKVNLSDLTILSQRYGKNCLQN